jgi:hypothetical protein
MIPSQLTRCLQLCIILLGFVACKQQECKDYVACKTVDTWGGQQVKVNQILKINCRYLLTNGCGGFGRIEEVKNEFKRTITVVGLYDGCTCPSETPTKVCTYDFIADKVGTYKLTFFNYTGTPETYDVVVTP